MNRRSIAQRLDRAKAPNLKLVVAQEWAVQWQGSTAHFLAAVERAVRDRDYDRQCRALGLLRDDLDKRFAALPGVLRAVAATNDEDDA